VAEYSTKLGMINDTLLLSISVEFLYDAVGLFATRMAQYSSAGLLRGRPGFPKLNPQSPQFSYSNFTDFAVKISQQIFAFSSFNF
jgi:hypothetical protein